MAAGALPFKATSPTEGACHSVIRSPGGVRGGTPESRGTACPSTGLSDRTAPAGRRRRGPEGEAWRQETSRWRLSLPNPRENSAHARGGDATMSGGGFPNPYWMKRTWTRTPSAWFSRRWACSRVGRRRWVGSCQ